MVEGDGVGQGSSLCEPEILEPFPKTGDFRKLLEKIFRLENPGLCKFAPFQWCQTGERNAENSPPFPEKVAKSKELSYNIARSSGNQSAFLLFGPRRGKITQIASIRQILPGKPALLPIPTGFFTKPRQINWHVVNRAAHSN